MAAPGLFSYRRAGSQILVVCLAVLSGAGSLGQQDREKITFHVTRVRTEDAQDWCTTGKCSATRLTVEGHTNSVEYVLECVEVVVNDPSPHYTILCVHLHSHDDYDAVLFADSVSFWDPADHTETQASRSLYKIVSEKEIAKGK